MKRWRAGAAALVAALALAGGCAWYRADQCRDAQARVRASVLWRDTEGARGVEWVRATGDVARLCWPA